MSANPGVDVENRLVALNQVHYLASKLWTEKIPVTTANVKLKTKYAGDKQTTMRHQQRRITPVQLPVRGASNTSDPLLQDQSQLWTTQTCREERENVHTGQRAMSLGSTQFDHDNSRKRAQIKTLPLKPPDIQSLNLFPPIGTESQKRISTSYGAKHRDGESNPFRATVEEAKFDPANERNKIFAGVQRVQTQITTNSSSQDVFSPSRPPKILKRQGSEPRTASQNPSQVSVEKGRSAELFSKLVPEEIEELKKLSTSFSDSLDSNLCRSVLSELTLLCQLLVANNDGPVSSLDLSGTGILARMAPRVWFVTRVFEFQLPLISSISSDIIQMLVDFYPHRIPKQLRKKFELIIQKRLQIEKDTIMNTQTNKFSSCVIFQTETDGKNNFPHQKDCQDFGKQRDLFYAIREIWTSRQTQFSSFQTSSFDPAFSKVKQLFITNSSSTNLSRLASLFLSQSLLDLNASEGNDAYDPISIENVQRIFQSNPTKYEKLRQRLCVSNSTFDGVQLVPADPIAFLKYFIEVSGSFEFRQHLIDHSIHEIEMVEVEASNEISISEAMSMIRKTRLLAQILGFLWFLPYRDDTNKKPIGPINVEIYLQSQIRVRSHQTFPLNLTAILVQSFHHKRLIFSLPWMIEFLIRADQVSFHLPAFKPILSFISCVYRELLPVSAQSTKGLDLPTTTSLSPNNATLLRFLCGKLFGITNFPDFYLFGSQVKSLADFLTSPLSPIKLDDGSQPLDSVEAIGSAFLPAWFRLEMKQMVTILSTNATIRGSIPSETPGIVKHIRPVPEVLQQPLEKGVEVMNKDTDNVQEGLEANFFQIHPSSVKKTVDFVSDRVSYNFLKELRSKILPKLKAEYTMSTIFGKFALDQCKTEIWKRLEIFAKGRCEEGVKILIGDTVSPFVMTICQEICTRNANEKVIAWVNQHVTSDLFPELQTSNFKITEPKHVPVDTKSSKTDTMSDAGINILNPSASYFLVLSSLHNTIQKLFKRKPIDDSLIDRILNDHRLVTEKPWVIIRTFDLALALITFSPSTLSKERLDLFIKFWRQVETDQFGCILRPRNFLIFSLSGDLKATYDSLSSFIKALLKGKLVSAGEIQECCMALLQQDWPAKTKSYVSNFLKEVMPAMEATEEKEVIDWIAWYCSGEDEAF